MSSETPGGPQGWQTARAAPTEPYAPPALPSASLGMVQGQWPITPLRERNRGDSPRRGPCPWGFGGIEPGSSGQGSATDPVSLPSSGCSSMGGTVSLALPVGKGPHGVGCTDVMVGHTQQVQDGERDGDKLWCTAGWLQPGGFCES